MKQLSTTDFLKLLRVLSETKNVVFLDTSKPSEKNHKSLLFTNYVDRIQCRNSEKPDKFLTRVRAFLDQGYYLAGWIGYEFGYLLEERLRHFLSWQNSKEYVLADLGVFEKPYFFDHLTGEHNFPLSNLSPFSDFSYNIKEIRPNQQQADYLATIEKIKEYIKAGDTYQVNYTLKLLFNLAGSSAGLYAALRQNQSVSYGAYIRWDDERVLSFSPELFFTKKDRTIMVKPMKGTMARGRTIDEDMENRRLLCQDPKNRSENVMIVDLLRNDLSRLMHQFARGSVQVDSLFDVEVYETLLQMTSTITGRVQPPFSEDVPLGGIFKALFPCGSVTGAPKIRTMEIINELEKDRRGVYTGAIGYLAPDGDATFNVPIRTLVIHGEKAEMGIGSGIVYDSDPENEWQECILKGTFLTRLSQEFQLIETLLWEEKSGYWLLEDHLKRLHGSADYFLFSYDQAQIVHQLESATKTFIGQTMRVRLTLAKDGRVQIEGTPCDGPELRRLPENPKNTDKGLPQIGLSSKRVHHSAAHFFHKSTRRELFDQEFEKAKEKGLFDVCFLNDDGELTEGCITNIFLYKDGNYITPSVTSGLLAGVMRKQLLADKDRVVSEKVITKEELLNADAIFLSNSVRGVVQVRLAQSVH